jgi:hypothetical protein
MSGPVDFDAEVQAQARRFAQLIFDEAIRRAAMPVTVGTVADSIKDVAADAHHKLGVLTGQAAGDLLRAMHNDAAIAAFRRELDL